MALYVYKAVVQLPPESALPEDVYVNDFYFEGTSAGPDIADDVLAIATRLEPFYNTIPTGQTKSLSDYIGDQVARGSGSATFLIYGLPVADLGDPWGSPVGMSSWTLAVEDSGTPMPAEVAVCLSFHGDLTNIPETQANPSPPPAIIRPAARRRGRVFIGPLLVESGAQGAVDQDLQPNTTFKNTLAQAAEDLMGENGTSDVDWVVYSPTALETHEVVGGFVDTAYDTQRRRGSGPEGRTLWP